MTTEDLHRCEAELIALLPSEEASPVAREHARSFNQNVTDVRAALLEPARDLMRKGVALHELGACLEKSVAELVFWRRVLVSLHGSAFAAARAGSDYLLRYVTS